MSLRDEIAAAAARMIAEDGMDYATAKKKAAKLLLRGQSIPAAAVMPDNDEIEDYVREYQSLFQGDTQPQRLAQLRTVALRAMQLLERFNPHLTGAALNGTAGEHSDIHLWLLTDSAKDVQMFLFDREIAFEVDEAPQAGAHRSKQGIERIGFEFEGELVLASVYPADAIRNPPRLADGRVALADIAQTRSLILNSADRTEPT